MAQKRHLKNQLYTLIKTENGYVIKPPASQGLVISGGGAKGLAYSGMIQAMHDKGLIQQLTHVGGASAGAMTASFLAVGMSPKDILKISTQLDITKLLDSTGRMSRAKGTRLRNIFELFYIFQMKQHMTAVQKPQPKKELIQYKMINQKIGIYEYILKKQGIQFNTIDDILELANSIDGLNKLDAAFTLLPEHMEDRHGVALETPRITFNDLATLRKLLPADHKYLIKHLSVVTTNQTRKSSETYNEDINGDASIAEKVQQSGAHPVLFKPAKNLQGEEIADGGIINNMPTKALRKAGLKSEEIICAKAEVGSKFADRVNRAQDHGLESLSRFYNLMDLLIKDIIGGRLFEGRTKVMNREKVFYHLGNMLYLNTGEINTTTTAPTPKQREIAIETAYQQTIEFIEDKTNIFDNALIAMLYLGVDKLNQTLLHEDIKHELFDTAALAKQIFLLQNAVIQELDTNDLNSIQNVIEQIEEVLRLDSGLNEVQQDQAMALCLKQINYFSEGKLEQVIVNKVREEQEGPKVNWFIHLLELLWKPIEWVLSIFSKAKTDAPNESTVKQTLEIEDNKHKVTPLRILSFLSSKEVKVIETNPDELMSRVEDDLSADSEPMKLK